MDFTHAGNADGGRLDLKFDIRYSLSTFWGEPLMSFAPRYTLGRELRLRGRNGTTITFTPTYSSTPHMTEPDPTNSFNGRVDVPQAVWNRIELSSYRARLTLEGSTGWLSGIGNDDWAGSDIDLNDEGVLGRSDQWGWDVAGSPAWSDVFVGQNAETAKKTWKRCQTPPYPNPELELQAISVDLVNFRHELLKLLPHAFDGLYTRPLDRQARSLIDAATAELRANSGASASGKLAQRRAITDKFFAQFSDRMDPGLRNDWDQVNAAIQSAPQIDARIRELKRSADRGETTEADVRTARMLMDTAAVRLGLVPTAGIAMLKAAAQALDAQAERKRESSSEGTPVTGESGKPIGELYVIVGIGHERCFNREGVPTIRHEKKWECEMSRLMLIRYVAERTPDPRWVTNPLSYGSLERILSGWQLGLLNEWKQRVVAAAYRERQNPQRPASSVFVYFSDYDSARLFRGVTKRGCEPELPPELTKRPPDTK